MGVLVLSDFMGELTTQVRISELTTARPGTKMSEFVALSHATNALVFVPGLAVRKLGNPNLRSALP